MRNLQVAKQRVKRLIESLLPETTYERRYRLWLKNEPELHLLPAMCQQDAIAVDVGANEGFFSKHLLAITKKVVAFEPLPEMLARLRARYENEIEIMGVVLSDSAGEGVLRYPAGGYMTATMAPSNVNALRNSAVVETVRVPMRTLDSYNLNHVGFIKIDVEGHEEAVVRGGIETLKREMPNLMIEIEERHAPGSLARVNALLRDLGYVGYYLAGHELHPIEEFVPSRDQSAKRIKDGGYINNFLFFPRGRADSVLTRFHPLLQMTTR